MFLLNCQYIGTGNVRCRLHYFRDRKCIEGQEEGMEEKGEGGKKEEEEKTFDKGINIS